MSFTEKVAVLLSAFLIGCGGGGGGGDKVTLVTAGNLFTSGDYANALTQYVALIPDEGGVAENGAGWCNIRLANYSSAATYFEAAADENLADANAGWAFALWASGDFSGAVAKAGLVLSANGSWALSLDPDVTANHLIWIQAESYLELQDYANCSAKCQALDSGFAGSTDPVVLMAKVAELGSALSV